MKWFSQTCQWFQTAFAAPFIHHRGVRVFHVLHREGWPLDYHFSWRTTRSDGDRNLPGEVFDIRKLPDYFERPGLLGKPELASASQWRHEHWTDRGDQIRWFIDRCIEQGVSPWFVARRRFFGFSDLLAAAWSDIHNVVSYYLPSAEERQWRAGDTFLGTHLTVTRMPKGVAVVEIEGSHWREGWGGPSLRQEFPLTMPAQEVLRRYRKFCGRLFARSLAIKSAHVLCNFSVHIDRAQFFDWAEQYRCALGLAVTRIDRILIDGNDSQDDYVFLAGDSEESFRRTLDFCGYLLEPPRS